MTKRGHVEEKHENSERWLLTYADLITLLLVFFVVMYSISKADERKFAKLNVSLQRAFNTIVLDSYDETPAGGEVGSLEGNSILEDFVGLRAEITQASRLMGIEDQVKVAVRHDGLMISLSGNVLFDSGRADLKPESTKILDEVAKRVRRIPNEIRVEGHTDNIPVESEFYPTNWELSAGRATVVARYLAEVAGIDPRRVSAQGFGQYRPVADNNTRESRALNRRVDIVIVYPTLAAGASPLETNDVPEPEGLETDPES